MAENTIETAGKKKFNVKYCVLLPIVLLVTLFLWCVPTSFLGIDGLTLSQQRVIALFAFAALMWMFEIIPNWTTSVLLIVVALLTVSNKGIGYFCTPEAGQLVNYKNIMAAFADPVVMLFLGGFVLAIMAEKYGLDVTLARFLLAPFGTNPKMVLLGFLIVISIFSMFMSNTATAAMMLATGFGALYFTQHLLQKAGKDLVGKKIAISGFGNVAWGAATKARELGAKVVAISGPDGVCHIPDGITKEMIDYMLDMRASNRNMVEDMATKFPEKAFFTAGKKAWSIPVDIALPCAFQNELSEDDAKELVANGCWCCCEVSNMGCQPGAIHYFQNNGILFAPGKAVNAGGVATSGLEMTQNAAHLSWSAKEVDDKLHWIMQSIHEQCVKYGTRADGTVDYVKGANIAGFMKVAEAMLEQGVI